MGLTENVKAKDENLEQNAADFSFDHKIFFLKKYHPQFRRHSAL